ncbi:MAG TPA: hypothetical protein VIL36_23590, partial [Acidimicrobiales bacterium]
MSSTEPTERAPAGPGAAPTPSTPPSPPPPTPTPPPPSRRARAGRRTPGAAARRGSAGRGSRPHEQLEGQLVLPGCEDPELERCRARHPAARRPGGAAVVRVPAQL